ncbi:hypothetical protein HYO65_gp281 [Tenacibaculum phage PTm1]|uniref:2'-5' RNA ligase n=2 Tax=Shirahamavirus PTm1 TaxID=2846435 RepID=A0A5S9HXK6_9CAUD|nr:hypothetical protein HYO65_gp281 [Tenacibaculum phage PTm1]BBI90673.1 hypothetical protein [Tenacibaculum phage PTm1]BBI90980.1 hypothetical protein [Tenacibaculum phage PTm5]
MKKVTYYFATQLKDVDNKFQEAQVSIPSTSLHFDDIDTHARGLETERHVTLYFSVTENDHISLVNLEAGLRHVVPQVDLDTEVEITDVFVFKTDKYEAIVAKTNNESLNEVNAKLVSHMMLYGIEPMRKEFKQHVTLGYVKVGESDKLIPQLKDKLVGTKFIVDVFKTARTDKAETYKTKVETELKFV